ncbi:unnamed protein product [Dibothriocephalus latus]|uniref:Uncharacterized protein n=1 Tax=Dibothriocephalus latus TaxID=60516 RepID=A0A3P7RPG9_DIBLA|nr:unnamed protein product [Dibothriocephalus latus]
MQNVRVLDQLQAAEAAGGGRQAVPFSPITAAAQEVAAAFLSLMESATPARDEQRGEEVGFCKTEKWKHRLYFQSILQIFFNRTAFRGPSCL